MLPDLLGTFATRKYVLLVNPATPGIETLRWQQLAARLMPQALKAERAPHQPVEMLEVPPALLNRLFSALSVLHGHAIAISCLHQMPLAQTLVCTQDFFQQVLEAFIADTGNALSASRSQAADLQELSVSLELLALSGPLDRDSHV